MSALYKKILVPLDGSDLAAQALPYAEEIARSANAQLILLRVLEHPVSKVSALPGTSGVGVGGGVGVGSVGIVYSLWDDEAQKQAIDELKEPLDELVTSLKHRKVDAQVEIFTGDPASQIVDYAAMNHVDLIVMSTHGRSGLARWVHGSVANKVLHAAACAVCVVRPSFP